MRMTKTKQNSKRYHSILLGLLPYWTPAIPPLGISCLKTYLQEHGYDVTSFDANMNAGFRKVYDDYFRLVRQDVPAEKRGNFFNQGMDAMRNHMMAHFNYDDKTKYDELVKIIYARIFYADISDEVIAQMNSVLDECYRLLKQYIVAKLEICSPEVLGLSVFSGNLPAAVYAFRTAKEFDPNLHTVMGGGIFSDQLAEGSPNLDYFLQYAPFIDQMIIGEGEDTFLAHLEGRLDDSKRYFTREDMGDTSIDVTQAVLPDFSDFDVDNYPQLGSYTSRSCPFQCSFCAETVHWGVYRKKTPRQIVDELKALHAEYGHQLFMMGDSLLNPVIVGLAEEFARESICLYWDGYLRADPPACEQVNTMSWRKGGYYRARLGVESGSEKVLESMNKKISVTQIKEAIRCLAQAGIKTTTYWICGHPGETEADFQATLDLIEEMQDCIWEAECNPFYYALKGQVDSDKWMAQYKRVTLFPEEATDMLVTQTWTMEDCHPLREVTYERVNRFTEHCRRLGIPNPYSLEEIYYADGRWQQLQKNAVPPLVELQNAEKYIDDRRKVKELSLAEVPASDQDDFAF